MVSSAHLDQWNWLRVRESAGHVLSCPAGSLEIFGRQERRVPLCLAQAFKLGVFFLERVAPTGP